MGEKFPQAPQGTKSSQESPQLVLATIAKEFAEKSQYAEAIELVKRSGSGIRKNLSTLLYIHRNEPGDLGPEVDKIFKEYIQSEENLGVLVRLYESAHNNARGKVSEELLTSIEHRLQTIDANWRELQNTPAQRSLPPAEEITDPNAALNAASDSKRNQKSDYFKRYLELGGDEKDLRYLKIRLNAILLGADSPENLPDLVRNLSDQLGGEGFKAWVQKNTRDKFNYHRTDDFTVPRGFIRIVLAQYILVSGEKMDVDDWSYIAERAVRIDDGDLLRVCVEQLSQSPHSTVAQKALALIAENGWVAHQAKAATPKSMVNDFYEPTGRTPVSKEAARAAGMWAESVMKS